MSSLSACLTLLDRSVFAQNFSSLFRGSAWRSRAAARISVMVITVQVCSSSIVLYREHLAVVAAANIQLSVVLRFWCSYQRAVGCNMVCFSSNG